MLHKTFLFDYKKFAQTAVKLTPSIEKGDYQELLAEANHIFSAVTPEKWILQDIGTSLEKFSLGEIRDSFDVGYLLLVVLSKYLTYGQFSLDQLGDVRKALLHLGWDDKSIDLLIHGEPTNLLIQPDSLHMPVYRQNTAPYYYWISPSQANHCGWLSLERIESLLGQPCFSISEQEIDSIYNNKGLFEYKKHVQKVFSVLSEAKTSQKGLFMILS